jgi:catechol 2,3-dioxygenase-like lactoylglutathione lyase family enzyme
MQVKHLDHLNLSVKDFDETKSWYARVFGFETVEECVQDGKRWGNQQAGEALLCVYEDPARAFLDGDQLEAKELHGVNHFSLRIRDREEWEQTIRRENVPVQYGGAYRYPHSTSWYVNDPTGYEIEVVLWDNDQVRFAL